MIVMHQILTKTRKVGGSIVVTLPKEIVELQQIKENEYVEITVKKCRKDGFGILKGMAPFTVEDEMQSLE
jgi:antitoxin component of MazEF toxin-antitoxin module